MTADSPELAALVRLVDARGGEMMAISGVAGVAVGLMEDERTPCLKVLVAKRTRELEQRVRALAEGHPVVIEETGEIRPLGGR